MPVQAAVQVVVEWGVWAVVSWIVWDASLAVKLKDVAVAEEVVLEVVTVHGMAGFHRLNKR